MSLTDTLRSLAIARDKAIHWKFVLDNLREKLEATQEWRAFAAAQEQAAKLKEEAAQLDRECRARALAEFASTGNRRPAQGVSIRMRKRYVYDEVTARDWLMQNAPAYLTVDARRFEKAASDLDGAPVTIKQEPQATIARDLSEYLP